MATKSAYPGRARERSRSRPQSRSESYEYLRPLFTELVNARLPRRKRQQIRARLVTGHLPVAQHIARRFSRRGQPVEDLTQVATVGLINAVDRFDPERGIAFSSFAVPTILGELRRHFRDRTWAVRVPRDIREAAIAVDRATESLVAELGHTPSAAEVAETAGLAVAQVLEAREAASAYRAVSLDRPRDDDDDSEGFGDAFGGEDPGFRLAEDAATVERLMSVLSDREREVLRLRFEEDLTQSEIGARVGVSQMHVSRLIRQAVARLRDAAAEARDDAA